MWGLQLINGDHLQINSWIQILSHNAVLNSWKLRNFQNKSMWFSCWTELEDDSFETYCIISTWLALFWVFFISKCGNNRKLFSLLQMDQTIFIFVFFKTNSSFYTNVALVRGYSVFPSFRKYKKHGPEEAWCSCLFSVSPQLIPQMFFICLGMGGAFMYLIRLARGPHVT